MEDRYLMGKSDSLIRESTGKERETFVSDRLRLKLIQLGIEEAFSFYSQFFDKNAAPVPSKDLVTEYLKVYEDAVKIGLFKTGGVREKDHLNLWCLGKVLLPALYVESGVFIGSSLHAFLLNNQVEQLIGIDPNLTKLKIDRYKYPRLSCYDDKDFSQFTFANLPANALVYFDDHINAALRIIQSHSKGFRFVLIDDATGLEGVCQRLYPAIPTIPMLLNSEIWEIGDEINWTWSRPGTNKKISGIQSRIFGKGSMETKHVSVRMKVDQSFIEQCSEAASLIARCSKVPDLGTYLPQRVPERMVDTTKYLIELKST